MPRPRQRVPLESGPKLDLVDLIPKGHGKPGTIITSQFVSSDRMRGEMKVQLWTNGGTMFLEFDGHPQSIALEPEERHFGGLQWYALCPVTSRKVRVLYRPAGARWFASRHAWKRRVAYASQFEGVVARAYRTQAKVKAKALGDADPDEWDFPPKPKGMRWSTYNRLEARFDRAEEQVNEQLCWAIGRYLHLL